MKANELETMRNSFNTVKKRSDEIKNSSSTKRLIDKVFDIKKDSINHLEFLINQLKDSFIRNGIECFYAKTSNNALDIIERLLNEYDAKVVAKSKSNTLGEINLKKSLASKNIEVVETDLGDRILQLKKIDNKPTHPTGPA